MGLVYALPDLGEGVAEAEVVHWCVTEGERVEEDAPMLEVTTAKATVQVPAPGRGVALRLLVRKGDKVEVGTPMIIIGEEGEDADALLRAWRPAGPHAAPAVPAAPEPRPSPPSPARRQVQALPRVRKLAEQLGVSLEELAQSGPITEEAVRAAAASAGKCVRSRVALTGLRRTAAEHLTRTQAVPAVTVVEEASFDALEQLQGQWGVSYLPFLIQAVVSAFAEMPAFNALFDERRQELVIYDRVDMAFAVHTEEGLAVPVIHDCAGLTLRELEARVQELGTRARARKLSPSESTGGTFTITSTGEAGALLATPLLNVPQVAIVGLHRPTRRPVVVEGELRVGLAAHVTLTHDHRVIDGLTACRFLRLVTERLSNPQQALREGVFRPGAVSPASGRSASQGLGRRQAILAASPGQRRVLMERFVLEQVARLLRLAPAQLGLDTPFRNVGMDSLMGMELRNALHAHLGLPLALRLIWEHPTPSALARYLLGALESSGASAAGPQLGTEAPSAQLLTLVPRPDQRHQPFPLTDLQQAYWLGQSGLLPLATTAVAYLEFDLDGVDLERLRLAFQRVIERHEMLRAIILADGQQQILERVPPFPLTLQDLRGKAPDEVTSRLEQVRHEMGQGTRTGEWPLVQVRIHQLDDHGLRVHLAVPCILVDALSMVLLAREVTRFYKDPEASLEPLALSYRDVLLAVQSRREEGALRASEDYWRRRLPTLPEAPELPLARAPSSVRWSQLKRKTGKLRRELWALFKQQAQRAGLTPAVAVLAAYAEVLSAWSKKPHFTLNLLYQNRAHLHPQILEVFGNLGTTLLLEVDHRTPAPFEERARRIQTQLWDDLEHIQVGGIQVMRERARTHGSGAPGMMPVVFASMLHLDPNEIDSYRQVGRVAASYLKTPQVWLDHQALEWGGELHFNWDVVEALFPERLIDDMLEAFVLLLERLADERAWSQTHFSLLPGWQLAERTAANATGATASDEMLHTLFAAQAKLRPQQEAIVDPRRRLTYGALHRRSNQVGRRLRELGARPNTVVAIVMEKGWEQAVAALGILASGAAYLPVDPTLPSERIQYLLRNAEVELVLTQPWVDSHLTWPEHVQRLCVDDVTFAGLEDGPLAPVQGPDDLAYVIFTSGSTGLPKGVMIAHRGAVNTIVDINQRFHIRPGDRVLALSSMSFDLSVYDFFGMLAAGGTIVLPDTSATRNPAHWADLLSSEQITVWNSVPALMQLLVEHLSDRPAPARPAPRTVLLSGDWIPVSLPDRIRALFEGVQVVSLGGATEASIWSIIYPIRDVEPAWQSIPYGRPMKGQRFHVLNEWLEPCPVWVAGELYIGGIGLAQGYWRDEEKTRGRFITHPRTGERLYRTGDVGRYLPGGDIEFMGREDFQVKIQGYRVELGEIEAALEKHPSLRSAMVTAVGEQRGNKRLVAYVVPRSGAEMAPATALRSFLREKLPEYMVPSSFVPLEALPLSSNGKVDRKALSSQLQAAAPQLRSFVAPRDATEVQLAGIWEHLLSVSPIGIHDSFFELGGNSFAAVRLVMQVQRLFGQSISLSTLLERPTLEQLASALRSAASAAPWSSLVALQPAGSKPPFFCVHAVGGSALAYRELARRLGEDQPFYGLQAKGVDTAAPPCTDIREMARLYLEEIGRIQPRGPYHLGGWSFGGLVAFEMAQQLVAAGETVSELVLLDTQAPAPVQEQGLDEVALLHLVARDLGLPICRDSLSSLPSGERLAHLNEVAIRSGLIPSGSDEPSMQRLVQVYSAHLSAAQRYTPSPYAGRLRLLRVQEPLEDRSARGATQDPTWGWASFVQGHVTVELVPGDHFTMVREPHVGQLAETLRRILHASPGS